MILMDGGMVAPIPVELFSQMCDSVSYVVAINTSIPLVGRNQILSPVNIANQVTTIMTADQLNAQLAKADIVITPAIEQYSSSDFLRKDEIIEAGYQAGKIAADSIVALVTGRQKHFYYRIAVVDVSSPDSLLVEGCRTALIGQSFTRAELVHRLKWLATTYHLFELTAVIVSAMVVV